MGTYCGKCGTELIDNVCPKCSQKKELNGIEGKLAKKLFMSPDEKFVTTLGNSYLEKFLSNGSIESGFAVVSDKRAYFQGTSYSITYGNNGKKQVIQTQQSRTVDLKDITGTGFDNHTNVGWLIGGLVWLLVPIVIFVISNV